MIIRFFLVEFETYSTGNIKMIGNFPEGREILNRYLGETHL